MKMRPPNSSSLRVVSDACKSDPLTLYPSVSNTSAMPLMPAPPMPTRWMCCVLRDMDVRLNPPAGGDWPAPLRCPAPLDSCRSKRLVDIMLVPHECIAFTDDCVGRIHSSQAQTRSTHCPQGRGVTENRC